MKKYRLTTEFLERAAPAAAAFIAVPVPPTTANQRVLDMTLPASWSYTARSAQNVPQDALFIRPGAEVLDGSFSIDIAIPEGDVAANHFAPIDAPSLKPGADACTLFEQENFAALPETERVASILRCVTAKFNYRHGVNSDLPLTCDVLTGNCLDINAAFIKLLRLGGVPNAYYIGYFFEAGKPLENDDWHCWVDTISSRGYENWDIAHYMKRGRNEIRPALNPIAGIRFAMSTGRDLQFECGDAQIRLPHLCEPRWVMADGKSKKCEIRVKAEAV